MSTPPQSSAEEVRLEVLAAHARLRARAVEVAAKALLTVRGTLHSDVPALVAELSAAVEDCDAFEERELVPLVSSSDPWGPARAERLRECHASHLSVLRSLARELARGVPAPGLHFDRIEAAVRHLLHDLDEEEKLALQPGLLGREDPIVVEQPTG